MPLLVMWFRTRRPPEAMTSPEPESTAAHWNARYRTIGSTQVSWYQPDPASSLRFIDQLPLSPSARIVDVGGGASLLVDRLLQRGFVDITVVDLSQVALDEASERNASPVAWIQADVREWEPVGEFDLWHDRATYHFLTDAADQRRHWDIVRAHVTPGGFVLMATFADDGPTMCSGLPVQRYSAAELAAVMGPGFTMLQTDREVHVTPSGGEQSFTWLVAQRLP